MPGLSSNPHSHYSLRVEGMPMDIEKSRFNMIEQQIRPWDVLDTDVLDLLSVVKREHYVPEAYRALAFVDMEIPLAGGQNMLAPRVEARVLQELAVRKHEDVLEVGAGSGYMAALLAHRGRQVTTLDIVPELVSFARDNLSRNSVTNVDVVEAAARRAGAMACTTSSAYRARCPPCRKHCSSSSRWAVACRSSWAARRSWKHS